MVFSSPVFVFLFLPVVLLGNFALPPKLRNLWLLLASLVFYAFGEGTYTAVMLLSVAGNYAFGRWQERLRGRTSAGAALAVAVAANLGLLISFKYANFLADNLNVLLAACGVRPVRLRPVHLPIGISFFTFQCLSYVVDVYRGHTPAQRGVARFGLYVAFFPQLIAGPIVRYVDVAAQMAHRVVTLDGIAAGVRRFVVGLAKKLLIANTLAGPADAIFGLAPGEVSTPLAWLGLACFTLQVYFDFSGYSDMALGLAEVFGFRFPENFNYPYVAQSVTEFWRRWHISLSTWFRDYLYVPLGGSRRGRVRTYLNLAVVFTLCGLWHGAEWNYLAWGLFNGVFMILERLGLEAGLARLPRPARHLYALLAVMAGLAIFRTDSMAGAWAFLQTLAGWPAVAHPVTPLTVRLTPDVGLALLAGIVGSVPWLPWLHECLRAWRETGPAVGRTALAFGVNGACLGLLLAAALLLAAGTYNPFIYFRF